MIDKAIHADYFQKLKKKPLYLTNFFIWGFWTVLKKFSTLKLFFSKHMKL